MSKLIDMFPGVPPGALSLSEAQEKAKASPKRSKLPHERVTMAWQMLAAGLSDAHAERELARRLSCKAAYAQQLVSVAHVWMSEQFAQTKEAKLARRPVFMSGLAMLYRMALEGKNLPEARRVLGDMIKADSMDEEAAEEAEASSSYMNFKDDAELDAFLEEILSEAKPQAAPPPKRSQH